MAQSTEPTNQELYADIYGVVCDAVERAWQHWPVERGPDEAPLSHTSSYAREAANRVMREFAAIWNVDNRTHDEIGEAETEFFSRLWYYRAVSGRSRAAAVRDAGEERVAEIEATYPNLETSDPFELGVIHGKLSALRWVLGDEWDNYDT